MKLEALIIARAIEEQQEMQSKNKAAMTTKERDYVTRIKEQPCVICDHPGPSEAHEIRQGHWWTSLPLCPDCHRGSHNGIHGRQSMWKLKKLDELAALNLTIERMMG